MLLANITKEEVSPRHYASFFVNDSYPVRVSVIAYAEVRAGFFLLFFYKVLEVLDDCRVRVVVGKPAVRFARKEASPRIRVFQGSFGATSPPVPLPASQTISIGLLRDFCASVRGL